MGSRKIKVLYKELNIRNLKDLEKAAKKLGYKYIVITDHAGFLRIAHALDEKQLLKQMKEIDRINNQLSGIKIIKGAEVDIKADETMVIKDEILAKLDFVLGSVHSNFKLSKEDMTDRMVRAMENENVDAITHPTGRVLQRREEYQLDFNRILKVAKKTKTALEINAQARRGWAEKKDILNTRSLTKFLKYFNG